MGCGISRNSESVIIKRPVDNVSNRKGVGVGHPVGGASAPIDKREAQLAAAEKRALKEASRGLTSATRGFEVNDYTAKQELLGKIYAVYKVWKIVMHVHVFV